LPVLEHRQLARQVGAFGNFISESSTDFINMIFPAGSTFVFGSGICEADHEGRLQSRLMQAPTTGDDLLISAVWPDQLAEKVHFLCRRVMGSTRLSASVLSWSLAKNTQGVYLGSDPSR
jgi:hypothetical protein